MARRYWRLAPADGRDHDTRGEVVDFFNIDSEFVNVGDITGYRRPIRKSDIAGRGGGIVELLFDGRGRRVLVNVLPPSIVEE